MKNKFIAVTVACIMILMSCITAFAGIESAVCDGNNIVVTGTTSTNTEGENFSLMLHNLYDANNPAESVVIAEQGVSGRNGAFSYTIPLAENIKDGNYTLRYGDNLEIAEEIELNIDRVSDISASMSEAGHIFFDPSDITVNLNLINGDTAQMKDIVAKVYTEDGNRLILNDVVTTRDLKAHERFSDNITIDLTKGEIQYGMFVLKLAIVPSGSEPTDEDFVAEMRFSVAKKSETANNKIGMHTQFGHGYADPEINAKLLKNAGFLGIRDYVAYSQCFTGEKWSEPALYNKWADDMQINNLSQIIQFDSTIEGFPKTETKIKNFTDYAVSVVSNLVEDGVYYYELWNEPNFTYTAEEYANLLISVAPAIHAVDENVKLLAFAAAGASNYHTANWIVNIIKILQEKNLDPHKYIDYISVHPYRALNQAPEKATRTCDCTWGAEAYDKGNAFDYNETLPGDSSVVARMVNLTNRLKEVDCDDIPYIATELGWYSYVGDSGQTTCEKCIANGITSLDEIGQAQYTIRAAALLHNKIEKIYFHTFNNKTSKSSNMERNFGFTETWKADETEIPYEAKPAFIAMANYNAMLGNAELIEENVDGSSWTSFWNRLKYDYVFQKDGKRTHMMWTTGNSTTQNITVNGGKAITIYDMYGNITGTSYNDKGIYTINLSQSPVYVEETPVKVEVEIVNKNGKAVSEIGDNTELCAAMNVLSAAKEKGILVCAAYEKDILVRTEVVTVESGAVSASTPYINTGNADMIKAFYWKMADNTPYCEAISIFGKQK